MLRPARIAALAVALPLLLGALLAAGALTDDPKADGAELRARADAVCLRAHDRLAGLDPLDSAEHVARSGPRVVATTLDTARRLLALHVTDDIRRYAQHLIRQADLASRLQEAARTGDRARAVALIGQISANSRAGQAIGARISPGCGGATRPAAPRVDPRPHHLDLTMTKTKTMTKTTIMLAAVLATVTAAGCGGSSGSRSTTTSPTTGQAATTDGHRIFTTVGCSNCHTLAAAGARGQVGPDLDQVKPTFAKAVRQVTHGGGAMPPFSGQLSSAQIRAVARYLADNAGR